MNLFTKVSNNLSLLRKGWKAPLNKIKMKKYKDLLPDVASYSPMEIDMEPTIRCNFRCEMCQTTTWDRKADDLSLDKFQVILKQLPFLSLIKLQGMGEPLLNEQLFSLIKLSRSKDIAVKMVTNGSLLNKTRAEELLASGINQLMISVDGATAATHNAIRKGSNFNKLLKNIEQLVHMRGFNKKTQLEIWTVVQKKNYAELPDLVRLASSLGIDKLTFQMGMTSWGKEEMKETINNLQLDKTPEDIIEESVQIAKAKSFNLEIYRGNLLEKKEGKRCWWPWTSCYITCDGFVTPCCICTDPRVVNYGNVFETPFEKIWNSENYKKLRRMIREDDIPDFCKACYRDV